MSGRTMPNNPARVAVDVMGGDFGPHVTIPGALQAARKSNIPLLLAGHKATILSELEKHNLEGLDIEIEHADEVAAMKDKPSHIRRKKNTSIQAAFNAVKEQKAKGVVSAGHTGVTLATGMFLLGRLKGIERPGLAAIMPREHNPLIIIDVGANVDSKPRHLVQFAIMAEALAKNVLSIEEPRVGLLSIGEEQGKGNAQVNEAFSLLSKTTLNFSGNVEGRDLFDGTLDIAVCDGFVGNVILKMSEGWGKTISGLLRQELKTGFWSKLGSLLSLSAFKRFSQRLDYEEYGGAPLLGLKESVFICHGSSGQKAIQSAVVMTASFISTRANEDIRDRLESHPEISKFHRFKTLLHTSGKGQPETEDLSG